MNKYVQTPFPTQAFYDLRPKKAHNLKYIPEFTEDFCHWYRDNLKRAPKLSSKQWMTAYSTSSEALFYRIARRGFAGYMRKSGAYPDLTRPTTFGSMNTLNSIIMPYPVVNPADKLLTAKYIPKAFQDSVRCAKIFRVFDTPEQIDLNGLRPGRYYLKANHGSAQGTPFSTDANAGEFKELQRLSGEWGAKPYGQKTSQWWYRLIDRKTFVEEDLSDMDGIPPDDFKFHMINGKIAVIQVVTGRSGDRFDPVYDADLNYVPHDFLRANNGPIDLPEGIETAKAAALEIAKKFRYIRVDFYIRGREIILGELTLLPNAGRRKVKSAELNEQICSLWDPMPQIVGISSDGD